VLFIKRPQTADGHTIHHVGCVLPCHSNHSMPNEAISSPLISSPFFFFPSSNILRHFSWEIWHVFFLFSDPFSAALTSALIRESSFEGNLVHKISGAYNLFWKQKKHFFAFDAKLLQIYQIF
jgi:hypothetical protein